MSDSVPQDCSPPGSSVHGTLQQEHQSGLPCPSPGGLPDPGIEPRSPGLQVDSLPSGPPGNPIYVYTYIFKFFVLFYYLFMSISISDYLFMRICYFIFTTPSIVTDLGTQLRNFVKLKYVWCRN